jgi:hypothetical protein
MAPTPVPIDRSSHYVCRYVSVYEIWGDLVHNISRKAPMIPAQISPEYSFLNHTAAMSAMEAQNKPSREGGVRRKHYGIYAIGSFRDLRTNLESGSTAYVKGSRAFEARLPSVMTIQPKETITKPVTRLRRRGLMPKRLGNRPIQDKLVIRLLVTAIRLTSPVLT